MLIKELLKRETEDGSPYFREATITASDGRTQILGLIAGLEMKLTPNDTQANSMREFFDYLIVNESTIELVVLSSIGLTAFIFILMLAIKK